VRLIRNSGNDRVVDELRRTTTSGSCLDLASPEFSLFAFSELRELLEKLERCRMVLPVGADGNLDLLGSTGDRASRNRLQTRRLAKQCAEWLTRKVEVRDVGTCIPQSAFISGSTPETPQRAIAGTCPFTTRGLGLTPGNQLDLIQCAENAEESKMLGAWFDTIWSGLSASNSAKEDLLGRLQELVSHKAPSLVYHLILYNLFKDMGGELDEERIVRSATGIRDTAVWNKLYRFQRDGVVGAIDKLDRFGGCIIADSVGLGKTFEALAVIKYHELRNDRVLVLCPKRLRDNWTLYCTNDRRNVLAADRFNYDVLNHTDLSRDGGLSGDIDLIHVNWGNYDLVVIDESHNFRNKPSHAHGNSRYDRLMRDILRSGVRTRVLMLSATPVNNRLTDLRNQISFITEGDDTALSGEGIASIDSTVRLAQKQFNRWLRLEDHEKSPMRLIDMLGFDYFRLLDLLTIARSRKHVQRYYGTEETGRFPDRLKPVNLKTDVDAEDKFPPVRHINDEIRRLNLAAYAPLRYVLRPKQKAYDEKYSTRLRGGAGFFHQADREESLVHLLRVNMLKRMESSVVSFALTLERSLADVDGLLARIDGHDESIEELSISDVDVDDPDFEPLLVGRKVKVLLQDMDRISWRQDLQEDRNRLASLLAAARQIGPARDAKLHTLRDLIARKCAEPLNPGNRKVLVFTAFADTARYLYRQLAPWASDTLGLDSALVTGTGANQTTMEGLRTDLGSILTAFSPRSKERPEDMASDGELDLLIATDCISEGQNLQDCDTLVNYDIHWNPVRIIQRFGRIDRIGSTNERVRLVNFWPNMELEEYIRLEQRVSGRMVLLDVSATGEENLIEYQPGSRMNDLEYRRRQLLKLQDVVIDLEDLSSGVSITDLTLGDFRIDLAGYLRDHPGVLEDQPLGTWAVTTSGTGPGSVPPGVLFCLRAENDRAQATQDPGYPLAPHYLVHVGVGDVLLPYPQARQALERLKTLCHGADLPLTDVCQRFDRTTGNGDEMFEQQALLAAAVASVVGRNEERAVASLFTPGGTHARNGEFAGIEDFEVVAFLVVLPEDQL